MARPPQESTSSQARSRRQIGVWLMQDGTWLDAMEGKTGEEQPQGTAVNGRRRKRSPGKQVGNQAEAGVLPLRGKGMGLELAEGQAAITARGLLTSFWARAQNEVSKRGFTVV